MSPLPAKRTEHCDTRGPDDACEKVVLPSRSLEAFVTMLESDRRSAPAGFRRALKRHARIVK